MSQQSVDREKINPLAAIDQNKYTGYCIEDGRYSRTRYRRPKNSKRKTLRTFRKG